MVCSCICVCSPLRRNLPGRLIHSGGLGNPACSGMCRRLENRWHRAGNGSGAWKRWVQQSRLPTWSQWADFLRQAVPEMMPESHSRRPICRCIRTVRRRGHIPVHWGNGTAACTRVRRIRLGIGARRSCPPIRDHRCRRRSCGHTPRSAHTRSAGCSCDRTGPRDRAWCSEVRANRTYRGTVP